MVSILMPIYNGIEFIDDSINSVLLQSLDAWELIIGVNGHPENSVVFNQAKQYEDMDKRIRVFDLHQIKGKSNALNIMVEYCLYNHVALLDVDDIWDINKLRIQSKFIPYYDVIGSNCVYFGDKNGVIPPIPQRECSTFNFLQGNPIINSSCIIKKELCYWNPIFDGVEDYDLWIRLRKQHKKFYNCPDILVKHRIHNTSAFNSNGNDNMVKNLLRYHKN